MYETYVTIVGNVATPPVARRVADGATVVNFRVGSTERRYDGRTDAWNNGASLFVSVTCWRQLAENVHASFVLGDPIIARGRLCTEDYEKDGQSRTDVKLEAVAVGPDLSRSRARITRVRRDAATAGSADGAEPGTETGSRSAHGGDWPPVDDGRAVDDQAGPGGPDVDLSSDDQRERLGAPVEAGVGS